MVRLSAIFYCLWKKRRFFGAIKAEKRSSKAWAVLERAVGWCEAVNRKA
jgi:hypothetical protein